MAPLSESNVRQMRALFDLITELEQLIYPLLFQIQVSLDAHQDQAQPLDVMSHHGERLASIRGKAQDLHICTRDWISPLPEDLPGYTEFEHDMSDMIDALEHFFMTAHNFLVAPHSAQAPNPPTNEYLEDVEDIVSCMLELVESLHAGGQAVTRLLPAEGLEEVDYQATIAGQSVESSSSSQDATAVARDAIPPLETLGDVEEGELVGGGLQQGVEDMDTAIGPVTTAAVDAINTTEENDAALDAQQGDDPDSVLEDLSSLFVLDPPDATDAFTSLDAPEQSHFNPDPYQQLIERFASAFGTARDTANDSINAIQGTETETEDAMQSDDSAEPSMQPDNDEPRTEPQIDQYAEE